MGQINKTSNYTNIGNVSTKKLKLTGTTANAINTNAFVAHGLTKSKILSVIASVDTGTNVVQAEHSTNAGLKFSLFWNDTNVFIYNTNESAGILSKSFTIFIEYEA